MALLEIQLYSEVLMKEVSLAVILPLPTITNMEYGDHVAIQIIIKNIRLYGCCMLQPVIIQNACAAHELKLMQGNIN